MSFLYRVACVGVAITVLVEASDALAQVVAPQPGLAQSGAVGDLGRIPCDGASMNINFAQTFGGKFILPFAYHRKMIDDGGGGDYKISIPFEYKGMEKGLLSVYRLESGVPVEVGQEQVTSQDVVFDVDKKSFEMRNTFGNVVVNLSATKSIVADRSVVIFFGRKRSVVNSSVQALCQGGKPLAFKILVEPLSFSHRLEVTRSTGGEPVESLILENSNAPLRLRHSGGHEKLLEEKERVPLQTPPNGKPIIYELLYKADGFTEVHKYANALTGEVVAEGGGGKIVSGSRAILSTAGIQDIESGRIGVNCPDVVDRKEAPAPAAARYTRINKGIHARAEPARESAERCTLLSGTDINVLGACRYDEKTVWMLTRLTRGGSCGSRPFWVYYDRENWD